MKFRFKVFPIIFLQIIHFLTKDKTQKAYSRRNALSYFLLRSEYFAENNVYFN